jgi:hypothetical protein
MLSPDYQGGLDSIADIAAIVAKIIPADKANAWEIDQSAQRIFNAVDDTRGETETQQEIELLNQEAERKGIAGVDLTKDPLSEAQRIKNTPEPPSIWETMVTELSQPGTTTKNSQGGLFNQMGNTGKSLIQNIPGLANQIWNTSKSIFSKF